MKIARNAAIALAAVGLLVPLSAAVPTNQVVQTESATGDEQNAANEVAAFANVYAEPAPPIGSSRAELDAYAEEMIDYWSAVPWEAVAGQWGCDVESVETRLDEIQEDLHTESGVLEAGTLIPEISFIYDANCADSVPGGDLFAVEPRDTDPATDSELPDGAVQPQAWDDYC